MYELLLGILIGLIISLIFSIIAMKKLKNGLEQSIKFWRNAYEQMSKDANKLADEFEKIRGEK